MFTRCPHCQAIHPVDASLLTAARGRVVCGRCDNSFNALVYLSDEYPLNDRPAPTDHVPPVLGAAAPEAPALDDVAPETSSTSQWVWRVVLVMLALATIMNLAWTFGDAALDNDRVQAFLEKHDLPGAKVAETWRDPSQIHLVSRDIHPHPTQQGYLVLSATFINGAEQAQPYPELSLRLVDVDNHALAQRVFAPSEYLASEPHGLNQLPPGAYVPVLIEFADPGESAVGFELEFH